MPRVPFDWSPYEAEIRSLHTAGYAQERILDELANRYPERAFATRRSLSIQLESWGFGRRYKPQEDPEILEFIKSKWRKNATHAEILDHIQKVFPDVAISDRTLRRVRKRMKLLYRTPGGMMGNAEGKGRAS